MLRNYYINKEWIISETARRVYRIAAALSLVLFFFLFAVKVAGGVPPTFVPIARLFLHIGVLGAAITVVAMEYFLFRFDQSPAIKKVFWFCVMLFPPVGPPTYCFFVYSRSAIVRKLG
jgi:hypothetical protein